MYLVGVVYKRLGKNNYVTTISSEHHSIIQTEVKKIDFYILMFNTDEVYKIWLKNINYARNYEWYRKIDVDVDGDDVQVSSFSLYPFIAGPPLTSSDILSRTWLVCGDDLVVSFHSHKTGIIYDNL